MKMQQKLAAALCAFYLITVIGFAVNMHFCSGKLSSVKLNETAKCSACKSEKALAKKHDCCETSSIEAKITDSHEAGFKVKLPQDFSITLFLTQRFSFLAESVRTFSIAGALNKAPPLSSIFSLHLLNCVFRN
jgi:hypothetical protein